MTERQRVIASIIKRYSQYSVIASVYHDCVTIEKVWNRKLGRLALLYINCETKTILINTALFNKADRRHLDEILEKLPELRDYAAFGVYFGYPFYYNYGFLDKSLTRTEFKLND